MSNRYIHDAVGHESANVKLINASMHEIKNKLYDVLSVAQASATGIKRFTTTFSEENMHIERNKISFTVPFTFIKDPNRIKYRNKGIVKDTKRTSAVQTYKDMIGLDNTGFYKREMTMREVMSLEGKDVFLSEIIVFIDGYMYTNFTIKPFEDKTIIYFKIYSDTYMSNDNDERDGLLESELAELMNKKSKITFLLLPNEKTARYVYKGTSVPNKINIYNFIPSNGTDVIEGVQSPYVTDPFLCMVNPDSEKYKYTLIDTTSANSDNTELSLAKSNINVVSSPETIFRLLYIKGLYEKKFITANTLTNTHFELLKADYPIPTSNLVIFAYRNGRHDGYLERLEFIHDDIITLKYPNIYMIDSNYIKENKIDGFIIYSFYSEVIDPIMNIGYADELSIYHKYGKGIDNLINNYNATDMYVDEKFTYNGIKTSFKSAYKYKYISKIIVNDEPVMSDKYDYNPTNYTITFKEPPGIITTELRGDGVTTEFAVSKYKSIVEILIYTDRGVEKLNTNEYTYDNKTNKITFNVSPDADSYIAVNGIINNKMTVTFIKTLDESAIPVPEYIMNYNPSFDLYEISDFLKNYDTSPFDYKISKLNSLIEKYGFHYLVYLDKLNRSQGRYNVQYNMSQQRVNNYNEVTEDLREIFDTSEESYYIPINLMATSDIPIIFVGNNQFTPKYTYIVGDRRVAYIPKSLIENRPLISVEYLTNEFYSTRINISNDISKYIKVVIPETYKLSKSDIFLSYIDNSSSECYMPNGSYDLCRAFDEDENGQPINPDIIDDEDFYPYSTYYVKINDEAFINTSIFFRIAADSFVIEQFGNTEFNISRNIKNDINRFTLFKNGKRIPVQGVKGKFSEKVDGPHKINGLLRNAPTERFTLVYNNTRYTRVDLSDYIDATLIPENGIIDLTGYIDKPLSFNIYDIYMNGEMMDDNTAEFIGPYILRIKNVTTRRNLELYEKNFNNLNQSKSYITNDSSSFIYRYLYDYLEFDFKLDDIDPDILDELIIDYIQFLDDMSQVFKIINPDINQITDKTSILYRGISVSETDLNIFIDSDDGRLMEKNIFINPDAI